MARQLDVLKKKVKKNPQSLLFSRLADMLREEGDLDSALPIVEQGLAFHPENLSGLLIRARVLFDMNELEEAESTFRQVLQLDSSCLSARRFLGEIYTRLNDRDKAEEQLVFLQALDPFGPSIAINGGATADLNDEDVFLQVPDVSESDEELMVSDTEEDLFEEAGAIPSDDIEAALDRVLGEDSDDSEDGPSVADLSSALDDAIASNDEVAEQSTDSSISAEDLDDALDSLFGEDDSFDEDSEEKSKSASAEADTEASEVSDMPDLADVDESSAEIEKPSSPDVDSLEEEDVSSALDSLFGDDDDLPEERPNMQTGGYSEAASTEEVSDLPQESPVPSEKESDFTEEDDSDILDNAFDELFGDSDELPEENPTLEEEPDSGVSSSDVEESIFEKSAEDASSILPESEEITAVTGTDNVEDTAADVTEETDTLDNAFDELFGESDDLPEENDFSSLEEEMKQAVTDEPVDEPSLDDLATALDESVSETGDGNDSESFSDAASNEEEQSEDVSAADEVGNAIDNLFGSSDDDLPEERSEKLLTEELDELLGTDAGDDSAEEPEQDAKADSVQDDQHAEDVFAELRNIEEDSVQESDVTLTDNEDSESESEEDFLSNALDDTLNEPEADAETDSDKTTKEPSELPEATGDEVAQGVSDTLDEMFGADDDLPEEQLEDQPEEQPASNVENEMESSLDAANDDGEDVSLDSVLSAAPAALDESLADSLEDDSTGLDELDDLEEDLFTATAEEEDAVADLDDSETAVAAGGSSLEDRVSDALDDIFPDDDLDSSTESGDEYTEAEDSGDDSESVEIDKDTDQGSATVTLAEIYFQQGLIEQSLKIYRQLQEREPENEEVLRRIKEIEQMRDGEKPE